MEPSFRPRVHWNEGMFLSPHHFQQRDLHAAEVHAFQAAARHPFPWGITSLTWDQEALSTGTLRVTRCTGILPDGSPLHHVDFYEPLEFTIRDEALQTRMQERGEVVSIYLGLASDTRRMTGGEAGTLFRYGVVHPEQVPDINSGENPREVAGLRSSPRLILDEDRLAYFTSMKIGEVYFKLDHYHLTDWIPPTVRVQRSTPLHEKAQNLVRALRSKAGELVSQVDSARSAGSEARTLEARFQVRSVLHAVPVLETYCETECAHPIDLYHAYLEVVTQLAVLTPGVELPRFPTYRHEDLRATFQELSVLVERLMEQISPERFQSGALVWKDDSFVGAFDKTWEEKTVYLVARKSPTDDGELLRKWVEKSFIARADKIDWCRNAVYPGAKRSLVQDPPAEISPGRGYMIFRLEDDARGTLSGDGGIVVTPPAMMDEINGRPAELRLYVES